MASKYLGEPSFDTVCVNERVGVGFEVFASIESGASRAAVFALAFNPSMLETLEPDVPVVGGEGFGYGVFAGHMLRAIHTASGE